MIIPGAIAVVMPVIVGFILSAKGLGGMLIGSLSSGCMLAIAMSNAGGAWDNAKKYAKQLGLNKTEKDHFDATVVGDTVGDPFKDTSGPALNILIKLMSVISFVIAGAQELADGERAAQGVGDEVVIVGAGIFVALMATVVLIQRNIDLLRQARGRKVDRRAEGRRAAQEGGARGDQKANAEVHTALKKIVARAEDNGAVDAADVGASSSVKTKPVRWSRPDCADHGGLDGDWRQRLQVSAASSSSRAGRRKERAHWTVGGRVVDGSWRPTEED